jgi:hypothetical protein
MAPTVSSIYRGVRLPSVSAAFGVEHLALRELIGAENAKFQAIVAVKRVEAAAAQKSAVRSAAGQKPAVAAREEPKVCRLSAGGERIRTFGSAMRSHRRQPGHAVTTPDPGGEWRLLGPPPDTSIGTPRPATADERCAGRSVPTRTNLRNRCLSNAEPMVRIHLPPAKSQLRT